MMVILLLNLTSALNATLHYDKKTCRYTTTPAAQNIDQNLYHKLVWECKDILEYHLQEYIAIMNMGCNRLDLSNLVEKAAVEKYLKRLATPTSLRLLADIQALKFEF